MTLKPSAPPSSEIKKTQLVGDLHGVPDHLPMVSAPAICR